VNACHERGRVLRGEIDGAEMVGDVWVVGNHHL